MDDRIIEPLPESLNTKFDSDSFIYIEDNKFYYGKDFSKDLLDDIINRNMQIYAGYYEYDNGWDSPRIYLIGRGRKAGKFKFKVQNFKPYCYIDSHTSYDYHTYLGQPVEKLIFETHPALVAKFRDIRQKQGYNMPYEADILFVRRFLCDVYNFFKSEKLIQPNIAIVDIETDHPVSEKIIAYAINNMVDDIIYDSKFISTPYRMAIELFDKLLGYDIITGWNVDFDVSTLERNIEVVDRFINIARQNKQLKYQDYLKYYYNEKLLDDNETKDVIDTLIECGYLKIENDIVYKGDKELKSYNTKPNMFKSVLSEMVATIDLIDLSKKMYAREIRGKWTLGNVGTKIVGLDKVNLGGKKIRDLNEEELMEYNVIDTIIPELIEGVLGGLDSHIILGWSLQSLLEDLMLPAVINDIALIRAYHKNKQVLPSRNYLEKSDKKAKYRAADPDAQYGIYEDLLTFDLSHAYPFAVISKNISPETKDSNGTNIVSFIDKDGNPKELRFNNNKSVFIDTLKDLMNERKSVKTVLKTLKEDNPEYKRFKSIDFALKTQTAAFSHGIFGWSNSRMVDYDVADAITAIVRNLLENIKTSCDIICRKWVYLHTDSCYINAPENEKDRILSFLNGMIKDYCKDFIVLPNLDFKGYFGIAYIHSKARNVLLKTKEDIDKSDTWDEPPNKVTGMNFMRAETPEELAEIEIEVIKQKMKRVSDNDILLSLRERIKHLPEIESIRLGLIKPLKKNVSDYERDLKDGTKGGLPYHIKALLKAEEEYGFTVDVGDKFMIIPIITGETVGKKKKKRKRVEIAFPIETGLPNSFKIDYEYYLRSNLWGKINNLFDKTKKDLEKEIMTEEVLSMLNKDSR